MELLAHYLGFMACNSIGSVELLLLLLFSYRKQLFSTRKLKDKLYATYPAAYWLETRFKMNANVATCLQVVLTDSCWAQKLYQHITVCQSFFFIAALNSS